jgi:hypothetical protein
VRHFFTAAGWARIGPLNAGKSSLRVVLALSVLAGVAGASACSLAGLTSSGTTDAGGDAAHDSPSSDSASGPDSARDVSSGPDAGDSAVSVDSASYADAAADVMAAPDVGSCGDGGAICVPSPPIGWIGPLNLWEGAALSTPPTCGTTGPAYTGNASLDAGPATCAPCGCGGPSGVACAAASVDVYVRAACEQGFMCSGSAVALTLGQCAMYNEVPLSCGSAQSFELLGGQPSGGTCTPSGGGMVSLPMTTWDRQAVACTAAVDPNGPCGAGDVCALPGAAPLSTAPCIAWVGGAMVCPSPYTQLHLYQGGVDDMRSCSACSCDPPTNASCSGSLVVQEYQDTACATPDGDASTISTGCINTSGQGSLMITGSPNVASAGSCTPAGGTPTGTASPSNPTTVCCLP